MEVIALMNQKGGVGKTTSTANIGSGLAILGKRVLLIDLDPQAHLAHSLGIRTEHFGTSLFNVLRGEIEPSQALVQKRLGAIVSRPHGNSHARGNQQWIRVTLLPSTLDLSGLEAEFFNVPGKEFLLRTILRTLGDRFDYALIDCPPSLGLLSVNALTAANRVDIPVQTEYLALESVGKLITTIERVKQHLNPELQLGGIIATRYDHRKLLNKEVVDKLRVHFGALLFKTLIRENVVLAEAPSHGMDIFSYRPGSHGAQDYLRLSEEILERSWRYGR